MTPGGTPVVEADVALVGPQVVITNVPAHLSRPQLLQRLGCADPAEVVVADEKLLPSFRRWYLRFDDL